MISTKSTKKPLAERSGGDEIKHPKQGPGDGDALELDAAVFAGFREDALRRIGGRYKSDAHNTLRIELGRKD